jgi:uncharacterized protein YdbL (DUF1318 family)
MKVYLTLGYIKYEGDQSETLKGFLSQVEAETYGQSLVREWDYETEEEYRLAYDGYLIFELEILNGQITVTRVKPLHKEILR